MMRDKPVLLVSKEKLEPGPQLDKLMVQALGLPKEPYSVDFDTAWLIIKVMEENYLGVNLRCVPDGLFSFPPDYEKHYYECQFEGGPTVPGLTVSHAICLAALHTKYQVKSHA